MEHCHISKGRKDPMVRGEWHAKGGVEDLECYQRDEAGHRGTEYRVKSSQGEQRKVQLYIEYTGVGHVKESGDGPQHAKDLKLSDSER